MDNKVLLTGIMSFIGGALLVSVAATTFEKPTQPTDSMSSMVRILEGKQGDAFDEAFIREMIVHHQGAIDMAHLAKDQAKHTEIKQLADNIIDAQESEISQMQLWQRQWNYQQGSTGHQGH